MRIWILTTTVALSVLLVPAAPAMAACAWGATQVTIPGGYSRTVVNGAANNSALIAGHAIRADGGHDAVIWNNGVPQVLPNPFAGGGSNRAEAVNDTGVVAGVWRGPSNLDAPWRYQNGAYQMLPLVTGTMWYTRMSINNPGDIIAAAYCLFCNPVGALWKATTPGEVTRIGENVYAIGIDDTGRYVTDNRIVVNPDGSRFTLQPNLFMRTFSRGHILGENITTDVITEWNVAGQVTRQFPGQFPHAVNTAGVIVGLQRGATFLSVRNGSVWEPMTPPNTGVEDITNGNVIVANFNHDVDVNTPYVGGVYRRSCS